MEQLLSNESVEVRDLIDKLREMCYCCCERRDSLKDFIDEIENGVDAIGVLNIDPGWLSWLVACDYSIKYQSCRYALEMQLITGRLIDLGVVSLEDLEELETA